MVVCLPCGLPALISTGTAGLATMGVIKTSKKKKRRVKKRTNRKFKKRSKKRSKKRTNRKFKKRSKKR